MAPLIRVLGLQTPPSELYTVSDEGQFERVATEW